MYTRGLEPSESDPQKYFYNGFGERIHKSLNRLTKTFQYNGNGQLLVEQHNQKKRIITSQDTVWINGQAIAQTVYVNEFETLIKKN